MAPSPPKSHWPPEQKPPSRPTGNCPDRSEAAIHLGRIYSLDRIDWDNQRDRSIHGPRRLAIHRYCSDLCQRSAGFGDGNNQNHPAPACHHFHLARRPHPLGPFAITLTGQNFTSSSIASIGGMALPTTYSGGLLQVSGLMTQPGPANLTVTTHTATSAPFAVQIGVANPLVSPAAARRFLEQAAFGPTPSEAEKVQTLGYSAWLSGQLQMAQSSNYNAVKAASFGGMPEQFISSAVQNPDQLRQKVAFALSQIFVTSLIDNRAKPKHDHLPEHAHE